MMYFRDFTPPIFLHWGACVPCWSGDGLLWASAMIWWIGLMHRNNAHRLCLPCILLSNSTSSQTLGLHNQMSDHLVITILAVCGYHCWRHLSRAMCVLQGTAHITPQPKQMRAREWKWKTVSLWQWPVPWYMATWKWSMVASECPPAGAMLGCSVLMSCLCHRCKRCSMPWCVVVTQLLPLYRSCIVP